MISLLKQLINMTDIVCDYIMHTLTYRIINTNSRMWEFNITISDNETKKFKFLSYYSIEIYSN